MWKLGKTVFTVSFAVVSVVWAVKAVNKAIASVSSYI
jgi:hypothetical protein